MNASFQNNQIHLAALLSAEVIINVLNYQIKISLPSGPLSTCKQAGPLHKLIKGIEERRDDFILIKPK